MPITYIKGDLLQWPAGINVICHGCNSLGLHGAGIAAQIAKRYPAAAEEYRLFCKAGALGQAALGSYHVSDVTEGETKRRIIWLVTQEKVGTDKRQLDYEALYSGLSDIKSLLAIAHSQGRVWHLGLPQWIGGGLAGGSALVIQAMVEDIFYQSPVPCTVVEWEKGVK